MLCCYVIRILCLEGSITTNAQTIILRINQNCGLSTLESKSKFLDFSEFLSDCSLNFFI